LTPWLHMQYEASQEDETNSVHIWVVVISTA